jgi:hypothetical protein
VDESTNILATYQLACSVYSRLKLQSCSAIEEYVKTIPMPGTSATGENILYGR